MTQQRTSSGPTATRNGYNCAALATHESLACSLVANRVRRAGSDSVPQPYRLVIGARRERIAVGRPSHTGYAGHVAHQSLEVRAGRGVPDLGYTIGRSRCNPFSVGRYAHLADGGAVASELEARLVVRLRNVVVVWRCGGRGEATSRCLGRT